MRAMSVVFTIGYEGSDIDRFIETLNDARIEILVDVRAVALSRKFGFSKKALSGRLDSEGIAYLHLQHLGDPKAGREAARAGRYDDFRSIYGSHLRSPTAREAISVLSSIIGRQAACLMCFEREPETCHRSLVAHSLAKRGAKVCNLFVDQARRNGYVVRPRRHIGQGATAA